MRHEQPEILIHADITNYHCHRRQFDIICGGFPCQGTSNSGNSLEQWQYNACIEGGLRSGFKVEVEDSPYGICSENRQEQKRWEKVGNDFTPSFNSSSSGRRGGGSHQQKQAGQQTREFEDSSTLRKYTQSARGFGRKKAERAQQMERNNLHKQTEDLAGIVFDSRSCQSSLSESEAGCGINSGVATYSLTHPDGLFHCQQPTPWADQIRNQITQVRLSHEDRSYQPGIREVASGVSVGVAKGLEFRLSHAK